MSDYEGDPKDSATTSGQGWVAGDESAACPPGYPIKGNLSSKIAHAPGTRDYDATIAEVCFATEADAIAQGYRLSESHDEHAEAVSPAEAAAPAVAASATAADPDAAGPESDAVAPAPVPAGFRGYAIIETGGKQYRVRVGDRISVERLHTDAGEQITFDRVFLVGGDGSTRVGTPVVPGVSVVASVDDHFRGEKIVVFKYKPKKRYRRRIGHRQELSHLTITAING